MIWLSTVATVVAVWLLVPHPGVRSLRTRLGTTRERARRPLGNRTVALLGIGTLGAVALTGWGAGEAAVVTSAGLLVVTATASVTSVLRARAAAKRATEVARACELIGSLVAIGHIPARAVEIAAEDCAVLAPVASAQRVGADVPAALRTTGACAGAHGLVRLAQAWEVGERTGAPMGQALASVADAVRRDHAVEQVVAEELAAPRASGQVLAVLPFLGLGLGVAMGGEPIAFFTTGVAGPLCLVLGTGLACLGVVWTDAMVARATPARVSARRGERRASP